MEDEVDDTFNRLVHELNMDEDDDVFDSLAELDSALDDLNLNPIQVLESIFPDGKSESDLVSLLAQYDYDVTKALDALFDKANDTQQTISDTPSNNKHQQTCRHFLAGHCGRGPSCWYSHDMSKRTICRFWLQGTCMKGDSCQFLHEGVADLMKSYTAPTATSLVIDDQPPVVGSELLFPALPISQRDNTYKDSGNSHFQDTNGSTNAPLTPGKKGKKSKKGQILDIWSSTPSYRSPQPAPSNVLPTNQYATALKKAPTIAPEPIRKMDPIRPNNFNQHARVKVDLPWMNTGSAANAVYKEFRQEAIELAHARNEFFNRARDAFVAGKKAQAKSLSAQGHSLNDKMHQLHRKASEAIFSQRNSTGHSADGASLLIDLHGLHPLEAIEHVEERLADARARRWTGKVYVIAGNGHHSRGRAKVLPAVREALQGEWKIREGTMANDDKGGILVVYL